MVERWLARWRPLRVAAAVLVTSALVQGCDFVPEDTWGIGSVTWAGDGYVYFTHHFSERGVSEVWRVRPGGQPVAFVQTWPGRCAQDEPAVDVVRAFGGNGLAVALDCPDRPARVESIDLQDRSGTRLFDAPDLFDVAVDPGGTRGYVEQGVRDCFSVAAFSDGAVRVLDVRVTTADGGWGLSEAYRAQARPPGGQGCPGVGRAVGPATSADGRVTAMLVSTSPEPGGNSLLSRFNWRVAVLDNATMAIRLVGPDLVTPSRLAVSADGSRVVLAGILGTDLAVLNVAGGGIERLTVGDRNVTDPAFSPDGRTIAYNSDVKSIKFVPAPTTP
ncbi:TolB family protein [Dactylosporangium sp. McL0621]|uniref:TolB family protein n=1 Tax=Dactylosporangium sp. McL0621 TaxID=3415678 RepID=UPI003CF91AB6